MISDSIPWRTELLRVASRLEAKARQQRWTDQSSFIVERDIMVSAYAIRRFLESHKVSDTLAKQKIKVTRYLLSGPIPDVWNRHEIHDHYDLDHPLPAELSIAHYCNQLIHSFVWLINGDEHTALFDGVFAVSEKERSKHLYFFPVQIIADLCREVGSEDITGTQYQRGPNGAMNIIRVYTEADESQEEPQLLILSKHPKNRQF